jgi:retron-type reverse transcriptase
MVVKMIVEPRLEPCFHPSSFGYRPGKNAHQAVNQARRNCWRYDWVLDMDMKAFFDTIDHDLMMRAIEKHVPEQWIRLYIRRAGWKVQWNWRKEGCKNAAVAPRKGV